MLLMMTSPLDNVILAVEQLLGPDLLCTCIWSELPSKINSKSWEINWWPVKIFSCH